MAKKILLVEDEMDILNSLTNRLKACGFEVLAASDGHDGLSKAKQEDPDLIILDLMLPKMDGYKVCRMLKFDEKYKHIPVVLFTARAGDADRKTGKDVGADAYLVKPLDFEILLAKIKELLKIETLQPL